MWCVAVGTSPTSSFVSTASPTVTVSESCAFNPQSGSFSSAGNPYEGAERYVNPSFAKNVDTSISKYIGNSTRVALLNTVKRYPTFTWLDSIASLDKVPDRLVEASGQGNGKAIVAEFVLYNLPGRNCASLVSNCELPKGDLAIYRSKYIDKLVSILKSKPQNVRVVIIIEPDSLTNLLSNLASRYCDAVSQTEYPAAVAYAIANLSPIPDTYLYLDAAYSGKMGWSDNLQTIVPLFKNVLKLALAINNSSSIRGFAAGFANYSPFNGNGDCPARDKCPLVIGRYDYNENIDENLYTLALNKVSAGSGLPTRWLIDTSRSGQHTIRKYWGAWCNVKGAGLGEIPVTNPASQVDAFVWAKQPGISDGTSDPTAAFADPQCDPNDVTLVKEQLVRMNASGEDSLSDAPAYGLWFDKEFIMLVDIANPKIQIITDACGLQTTPSTSPSISQTSPTISPTSDCVSAFGQCGGKAYTKSTCCVQGYKCKVISEWYSQCV
ncbi:hypothetical protein HK098_004536 [Nowakowskiella sp. JEL0407]|nr:hypothetical protein HK098_004536 [Nowakowskiella sp. JEL0407]